MCRAKLHNPIENSLKIATNVNFQRVAYLHRLIYSDGLIYRDGLIYSDDLIYSDCLIYSDRLIYGLGNPLVYFYVHDKKNSPNIDIKTLSS